MKKITLDEYRAKYKNFFKEICAFLEDNNLEYSIAFGTMLGAIRHQDMIPWDVDIDIYMHKNEADKIFGLLSKLPQNIIFSSYVDNAEVFGEYRFYNKTIARSDFPGDFKYANIDIFVYDFFDNKEEMKKAGKKIRKYVGKALIKKSKRIPKNFFKKIIKNVYKLFCPSLASANKKCANILSKLKKGGKYLGTFAFDGMIEPVIPSEEYVKVKFGDLECSVFKNYDDFLIASYGKGYMTPIVNNEVFDFTFMELNSDENI